MDKIMSFISGITENAGDFFKNFINGITDVINSTDDGGLIFTAFARWVFIILALFILLKSIISLLRSKNPSEVWAYLHIEGGNSLPITHWENVIGRGNACDITIDDPGVSRNHAALTTEGNGKWIYSDLGSTNGALVNGEKIESGGSAVIVPGDTITLGRTECTLFPISLEEKNNNIRMRKADTVLISPWPSLIAITIFQLLTVIQLSLSLGENYSHGITVSYLGLCAIMWVYVIFMRSARRKGFEMETIAFFLSTLSLAVTATKFPDGVFKQFIAICIGIGLFLFMCTYLRNLNAVKKIRPVVYGLALALLVFNMIFATSKFGASNWVEIGGVSFQPSEIVKLAFIWVGAATLEELFEKKNNMVFMIFSGICFCCLALMGDFGTAIIFFVTFLVITFLRSGDVTKLIMTVGVAFAGGLMVLKFKSYIAERVATWGHVWEFADTTGFQQTRAMSAAASGGLVGVGAGNGWLKDIPAAETDLVFGLITEEWGLIIAIMAVMSVITLSLFAVRSILAGRSTYYTIAACSATSMLLFQTILNVFGTIDFCPLTGVTFPFISTGGTSIAASWGMLAFLKAADTRQNASIAISLSSKGLKSERDESV